MRINYEGHDLIVDVESDFCQLAFCYENGSNCYNCFEAFAERCPLDEIDLEEMYERIKDGNNIR